MFLVLFVCSLLGMEGILDESVSVVPVMLATLIGLVTGNLAPCLVLGGQLQMIALGWANIGAAVLPELLLACVLCAIILVFGGVGTKGVSLAMLMLVSLAVLGLCLTTLVRTLATLIVYMLDRLLEEGSSGKIDSWQWVAIAS